MSIIRPAGLTDAAAIRDIYAPSITRRDVATSFEMEVPTAEEIADRISTKTAVYPWLVMEEDGQLAGYAYADPHRARVAYQWCAEVSVYVNAAHHRKGVGRKLYEVLFDILRKQGVVNLYAGITLPNPGSVGLHELLGFKLVGIYESIGFKFGKAHDVGWWHLRLQPWPHQPRPITPVTELDLSTLLQRWNDGAAAG